MLVFVGCCFNEVLKLPRVNDNYHVAVHAYATSDDLDPLSVSWEREGRK